MAFAAAALAAQRRVFCGHRAVRKQGPQLMYQRAPRADATNIQPFEVEERAQA